MSTVICKLPKAGLGNQLFPLMHAYLFAQLNDLPVIVTGYHHLNLGPYLRGEKSKRNYNRFFRFQKSIIGEYFDKLRIKKWEKKGDVVKEPEVRKMDPGELKDKVFVFEEIAEYDDYFGRLKDHREQVKVILYSLLGSKINNKLKQQASPIIGVHIRMGDFRKLRAGEKFVGGHVRTPEKHFVDCISMIRKLNGKNLSVSVFTDGYKEELKELLSLEKLQIIEGNPDLVDLLLLSKSKIILSAHGSTFSAWAVYLSDAPAVLPLPYEKWLREDHLYEKIYEGMVDERNEVLRMNIKDIDE